MKQGFAAGVSVTRSFQVDEERTIDFMGQECRVYATPSLVSDMEHTCRDLLLENVESGEDSVGTKVSIVHMAPTPLGLEVTITATVSEIDGSRVVFDVSASDPVDMICSGRHERFVVGIEKTRQRLQSKAAKARQI